MMHELKLDVKYYQYVLDYKKRFELRKCDRPYSVGDTLHLREWDNEEQKYTGRELKAKVLYILKASFDDENSYCALSISKPYDIKEF